MQLYIVSIVSVFSHKSLATCLNRQLKSNFHLPVIILTCLRQALGYIAGEHQSEIRYMFTKSQV